jgi:hypothetical protein
MDVRAARTLFSISLYLQRAAALLGKADHGSGELGIA